MQNSFEYIAAFFIVSGFLCGFIILADILNDRPQKIGIMNGVWFLTGLWASWIGLFMYFKIGRSNKIRNDDDDIENHNVKKVEGKSLSEKILLSTLIYGAGCALANIIAESCSYFYSVYTGRSVWKISWEWDYILALILCLSFRYASIRPEKTAVIPGKIIRKNWKKSFPVITAWQAGVFAYSLSIFFGFQDMVEKNSWDFWFMMQIAMFCGFLTAYPVHVLSVLVHKKQSKQRRKTIRILSKLFIYALVLLILLLGIGVFYIDSIIKTAVNELGPKVTQTSVHLNDFSTSLIDTKIVLRGLQIGNPKGFNRPYALKLGFVNVQADRDSLFSDVIIIENVTLSDIDVTYELSGKISNLAVLNENISHYISAADKERPPEKIADKKQSGKSKKVIIKNLSVTNSKVNLSASLTPGGKSLSTTIDLPDLHLQNLGNGKNPMTVEQAAAYILNLISLNSLDTLAKSAYKNVLNVSRETIEQTKQAAEKLTERAKETVDRIKDSTEKPIESFKKLFAN